MPSAAPRPCRHPGCGALSTTGYCSKHEGDRTLGKFADERRGSRQSRGYGSEWDKKRKRILRRDKGLCQPHLKLGKYRPGNQVDHIVSKAEAARIGWPEDRVEADENLQTICDDCHKAKTASEAQAARRRGG